ncbi:hypothetical protein [Bacillus sp. GB_SG_008]|uniref:hypothetical protein n=1 Tax=Bacillus sp. GB_SG_008 TaxID=3454627 RepID=UPI003F84B035
MDRIRNHEQFVAKVKELTDNEYTILTTYVKSSLHLQMRHNSEVCCNHEYPVTPNVFLRGRRCPKCAEINKNSDKRRTHEEFVKEFKDAVGDEYVLLSKYKNERTKIKVLHTVCNQEDDVTVRYFLKTGGSCKYCRNQTNGDRTRKPHEAYVSEIKSKLGDEYTILGTYKSNKVEIEVRHNVCGNTWFPQAGNFLAGSRCDHCYGKHRRTTEEFKQEVFERVGNEYSVIGEYERALGNVEMIHNKCGFTWSPRPNDFLNNDSRCPLCSKINSKGSIRIAEILESNGIEFKREYRFEDCKHINTLPFDFKTILRGEILLIEFDGEQHFKPMEHWGGEEAFKETQLRDQIKNEYCEEKEIKLIRIKYTEYDNIESILQEVLMGELSVSDNVITYYPKAYYTEETLGLVIV